MLFKKVCKNVLLEYDETKNKTGSIKNEFGKVKLHFKVSLAEFVEQCVNDKYIVIYKDYKVFLKPNAFMLLRISLCVPQKQKIDIISFYVFLDNIQNQTVKTKTLILDNSIKIFVKYKTVVFNSTNYYPNCKSIKNCDCSIKQLFNNGNF